MASLIIALTFDVDCQGYLGDKPHPLPDELDTALDKLIPVFERHPQWRATWFLRIDPELDEFARQKSLLGQLIDHEHAIAWHYHGPLKQVARFARLARSRGVDVSRVGFGRGSNRVLRLLADAGIRIDSTAMPRPTYPWTRRGVDWTLTPRVPYRPSVADYRVPGTPSLDIVEVPISCDAVAAPGDDRHVVRYLNPAYHPAIFGPSVEAWLSRQHHLVTITHPYEVLRGPDHKLLSFQVGAFEENVLTVERMARGMGGCEFVSLGEIADRRLLEVASA